MAKFHTAVKFLPNSHKSWIDRAVAEENLSIATDKEIVSKSKKLIHDGLEIFSVRLPEGVIHGDLTESNLLVDSETEEITAVIDFEEAQHTILLLDLAMTALNVCFGPGGRRIDKELVRVLFEGYSSLRKLEEIEVNQFPNALRYVAGASAVWFLANGFEKKQAEEVIASAPNY